MASPPATPAGPENAISACAYGVSKRFLLSYIISEKILSSTVAGIYNLWGSFNRIPCLLIIRLKAIHPDRISHHNDSNSITYKANDHLKENWLHD